MPEGLVLDASVVVAALIGTSSAGRWAEEQLRRGPLAVPHLCLVETANLLRRAETSGAVAPGTAAEAHEDLGRLPWQRFPYEPFAGRVWELRHNVTSYDAWYVAVAEALDVPLATLDQRLVAATGPRCRFITPPAPAGRP